MLETAQKIFDSMKNIKYGWYDKNGDLHEHIYEGFLEKFRMQSTEQLLKSQIGMCFETVELGRELLEKENIKCKTYFFVLPQTGYHSHSILTFECNNKIYWFEASMNPYKGIHEYNNLNEILNFIIDHYDLVVKEKEFDKKDIMVFEYKKPKENASCTSYYFNAMKGKRII